MLAFVETTAFGDERGDDVVVTKSPDEERFAVVLHPIARCGGEVESNRSTKAGMGICASAQLRRSNEKRRVFIWVGRVEGGRIDVVQKSLPRR
jgi:hypothetical protein